MSIWTHVHGLVRYNRIQSVDFQAQMVLGNRPYPEYKFLSELVGIPKPMGSEGPMHAELWVNPEVSHLAAGHLIVWGDLRDFYDDDCLQIEEYFEKITIRQSTRDAVLAYYTEGSDYQMVLTHDYGEYNEEKDFLEEKIIKTKIERTA